MPDWQQIFLLTAISNDNKCFFKNIVSKHVYRGRIVNNYPDPEICLKKL